MTEFIKAVGVVDKVTDCIPIVSTVKNIGILLYQRIHKINKVANPVKTSWTDDLKIHALSKSNFMAGTASIPLVGNLTCLIEYVKEAALGKRVFPPPRQIGYLKEASRRWHYGTKKHSYEIAALYLARYPNRPEKKQANSLRFADGNFADGNEEVFKLILDSRNWSTNTLKDVLKHARSMKAAQLVLDKCNGSLTDKDIEDVLSSHCRRYYSKSSYPIIELLTQRYPKMDIDSVGKAIVELAENKDTFKSIAFLLKNFPGIKEEDLKKTILEAFKNGNKEVIELIEQYTPGIVENSLDQILKVTYSSYDVVNLNWLYSQYQKKMTPAQIGMVLAKQVTYFMDDSRVVIINEILSTYPDLPPECLIPVMENAAKYNDKIFEFYLNKFTQLEPQHLQEIFNNAILYGKDNDSSNWFEEGWKKVAKLIQNKFPDMKAVNPLLDFANSLNSYAS